VSRRAFWTLMAVVGVVTYTVGFCFAWYAMETGNGRVVLVVAVFALAGLADAVRRLRRASR